MPHTMAQHPSCITRQESMAETFQSSLMQAKATARAPYSQYDALASEGVSISWGDPADASALPDGPFDVVYDNNGKKLDVCKVAIDKYKVGGVALRAAAQSRRR